MKKIINGILLLLILTFLLVAIYIFVPYESYEYVRIGDKVEIVTVEYVNVTGNPLCSKLYFVHDDEVSQQALLARLPSDIPDPNRVDQIVDGNRLVLTGYRNLWRVTNRLTGSVKTKSTGLFDIVSWTDTLGQEHKTNYDHSPERFTGKNYIDCLD